MQRTQKTLAAGLVLGLLLSLAVPAQAQVYYVQSSNFRAVPVSQSVVVNRSFFAPRYSNYSYAQAWNNRSSAPAKYSESTYLPESSDAEQVVSSRSVVVSQPVVSSRVVSSQSFVAAQPRFFSQPVVTYRSVVSSQPVEYSEPVYVSQPVVSSRSVIYSQPVIYSEPVMAAQPVRVYRSVVYSPQVTREKIECRPNRFEYEQKGTFSAFDGRRVKTYRYEYEIDQRPGRTKIEFDIDD